MSEIKKLLDESSLPSGFLNRYQKDVYYAIDRSETFEEFQKSWEKFHNEHDDNLNKNNPVEFDKRINIADKTYICLFKRKGLDWRCFKTDYNPYGGCGRISLEEALESISDSKITEKILKIELGE